MQEDVPIGYMPKPANFKYQHVLDHGQPKHEPFDAFRLKHPSMPLSHSEPRYLRHLMHFGASILRSWKLRQRLNRKICKAQDSEHKK